ncbi:zeta toxin family protein [Cetobacterium sp. SF1]|uniref:zeta toxin family protein n=1 Tax=Cetobacterium sp. SF1 TaxID=3417654 RepID=UPI003CF5D28F
MDKPIYTLFAGVNGAGKSSLYNNLILTMDKQLLGKRINTDEIVKEIGDWKRDTDQMKAGRIALEKIKEFFLNKITFNQETTLCGNSILRTIKKAKDLGYTIDLHFVSVDSPEIAKERVHQRVLKGGHGIPEESIERRFYESRENLKKIISLCDKITIYDNTTTLETKVYIKNNKLLYKSNKTSLWLENFIEIFNN